MTAEDIKKIVDDECAEDLVVQFCHHWDVAAQRLAVLTEELQADMMPPTDAEIYAAVMRMQRCVMALMELNKIPSFYLFSEYIDRIGKTLSDGRVRQSVATLAEHLLTAKPAPQEPFTDFMFRSLQQHFSLPADQQAAVEQQTVPLERVLGMLAQHVKPEDLMTLVQIVQEIKVGDNAMSQEEMMQYFQKMRNQTDSLALQLADSWLTLLIWLAVLIIIPQFMLSMMQQSRTDSKTMAQLFNKVLMRVRKSQQWDAYWTDHRKTLRVVSDSTSWNDIMTKERSRERAELGKIPGGLFAKWADDHEDFEADFLSAGLSDADLRNFIFHLAALTEIARELNPTTRIGEEQVVNDELQQVGEAVLEAAGNTGHRHPCPLS